MQEVNDILFSFVKPQVFHGKNGVEVLHMKGFEQTCILINQYLPKDPKKMSTLEFYQALEVIKAQIKAKNKNGRKSKNV